eukprot:TRINITY_DN36749_c0_g4_i1.p2 TRINITY_DN36749_c0_g4~~TRINITY_DN36749_c0_g4_i1.p2  ORF type:complete len:123 (+),score=40.16 TRINITY_DN36749_c0_g4_i1:192-560(+)
MKMAETIVEAMSKDTQDAKAIIQFGEKVKAAPEGPQRMNIMKECVRQCKVSLCRNKEKAKVEVIVVDKPNIWCQQPGAEVCWLAMQRYLVVQAKAEKKTGPAPLGTRERKLMAMFGHKHKHD